MKISEVLIKSQDTRNQITGNLVEKEDGKISGYCALGALACEAKLISETGYIEDINSLDYLNIIKHYKIDPFTKVIMPKGNTSYEGLEYSISTAIYKLNDAYCWSFKRIGKWVEQLEKKGIIKYND